MSVVRLDGSEIPPSLRGLLLVDEFGVPRFWSAFWQLKHGAAFADTTLRRHLAAIERLYAYAWHTQRVRLDRVLTNVDLGGLSDVLRGFHAALSNSSALTGKSTQQSWSGALLFVRTMVDHLAPSHSQHVENLVAEATRQTALLASLAPTMRKKAPRRIRALPHIVVDELLAAAKPDEAREAHDRNLNPFRDEAAQWRNWVLLSLLLFQGVELH